MDLDFRRGTVLSAALLTQLVRLLRRTRILTSSTIRVTETPGGVILEATSNSLEITARIVARGSGAFYSWHEVYPTSGGAWADGSQSGTTTTDPTLEQNTNTAVPIGTRVRMFRVNGQWTFQLGPCVPVPKSPVVPPLPQADVMPQPPPNPALATARASAALLSGGRGISTHVAPP